jgi:hypothetical protein
MAADPEQLKQLLQLRPIEQAAADMGRFGSQSSTARPF